jgi:glycosyltransferase involved in cell wall biosynthesis
MAKIPSESKPLVSIVTPSFNQGQFLKHTIESVLSQSYSNIEYLIIDGGSTDSSVDIIKCYESKLSFWVSEKDKGQADAINKGWKKASGEILAYINSDDMLVPGAIEKAVSIFQESENIGIVYGDCTEIDENNAAIGMYKSRKTNFKDSIKNGQAFAQPAAFFNAHYVKQAGFVNDSLHLSFDYDLILKILNISSSYYVHQIFANIRVHCSTKTNTLVEKHKRESLRVRWKYGKRYITKPVLKYLVYRLLHSLPMGIQMRFRQIRKSSIDNLYISGKMK